ncbi:endonuclease/exonuclease/phosphatase family protein [Vibrio parahaemolyticus]|uniref:endonuclease/exonuclease/phosphatase family protein n=1 Tax=Vibrio parahaemolyticus TaxID=670 RepID=UPI00226AA5EC|nr:hypothetical protein [Vibrio parahaemolyticus]MCX8786403.1 endonuclease/exonuclease/phosphatase family protein [Vibrio parahaemolyticus]MCX8846498.1 endonuclease/exonuclease/phosphatase family protein [Vibrio parahaemolyticus]
MNPNKLKVAHWNTTLTPPVLIGPSQDNTDRQSDVKSVLNYLVDYYDLVLLSETHLRDEKFIREALKGKNHKIQSLFFHVKDRSGNPKKSWYDFTAIYNKKITSISQKEVTYRFRGTYYKVALELTITLTRSPQKLLIYLTHWPSKLRKAPVDSIAHRLSERMIDKEDDGYATLAIGDFNLYPYEEIMINNLRSTFCKDYVLSDGSDYFYNPFWEKMLLGKATYFPKKKITHEPHMKYILDQAVFGRRIMLGEEWKLDESSIRVMEGQFPHKNKILDHCPIGFEITFSHYDTTTAAP